MTIIYNNHGEVCVLYDVVDMFAAQNDEDTFVVVVKGGEVWLINRDDIKSVRVVSDIKEE